MPSWIATGPMFFSVRYIFVSCRKVWVSTKRIVEVQRMSKRLLLLVAAVIISSAGSVANADLVAYWKLNERTGNTAGDSSGNGYNGIIRGGSSWRDEGGIFDGALEFDGVDDHVDLPDFSITTNTITFVAWINGWKAASWAGIVFCRGNACGMHFGTDDRLHYTWNDKPETWGWDDGPMIPQDEWAMVAVVIEPDKATAYVYSEKGGLQQSVNRVMHIPQTLYNVKLGWDDYGKGSPLAQAVERRFKGLIDEVAIFDHALSFDQIGQVSTKGVGWFIAAPEIRGLIDAVEKAELMLKEHSFTEAIGFVERKIKECVRWREENAEEAGKVDEVVSQFRFQLAEAKNAVGAPKSETAEEYKQAIGSGLVSWSRQGLALAWLHEKISTDEYEDIIQTLLQNNSNYLRGVATQAEMMIGNQRPEAAIRFLELNLGAYEHWREKQPFDNIAAEDRLPELYFRLGAAREAAGSSKAGTADAYSKTFSPSCLNYVSERTAALIWLLENERDSEYRRAIKLATLSLVVKDELKEVLSKVCEHFESRKDWVKFKQFLNTLFAEEKGRSIWVGLMESCLGGETYWLRERYHNYLEREPGLKLARDCVVAEKYAANEQFEKAAELYRDITNRCGPEDNKRAFEFQLCKCLFQAGRYREAISELEGFIANSTGTSRALVKEAILMKARTQIHLGEPEKAIDSFFTLMMEYPEMEEIPESTFFVGYCYMLQGKFKAATEAFDCVIRGCPISPYVSRARQWITRIKTMTEEQ